MDFRDIFDIADFSAGFTYTFLYSKNQSDVDNSFLNKGERFENLPVHKFTFDFRTHFRTGTSFIIFGYLEYDQIQYVMSSVPKTTDEFATSYFKAERLHDPLIIDVKLTQKFMEHHEVYMMCRNILDDYLADPFNPGPGRTWYGGAKLSF